MITLDSSALVDRAVNKLLSEGLSEAHSTIVVEALVDADLRGHHSHGLSLLPLYVERIRRGGIDCLAEPEWIVSTDGVAVLDAKGAPGQVAARLAAERCAVLSARSGTAAVGVRNNNHVGMLAAYRMAFQEHHIVGLIMNISGPSVAPPEGQRPTIGNNALCLVIPRTDREPFVIDLATGVVACGKIREAAERGESLAPGWLLDAAGRPTTRPTDLDAGGAVPVFGGYKGLAISLIVELLAGVLAGQTTSPHVNRQRTQLATPMRCAQLFIGLNPKPFGIDNFQPFIADLENAVCASYVDVSRPPVYFPEQQEHSSTIRLKSCGIEITTTVAEFLGFRGNEA